MQSKKNLVSYTHTNSYETLNEFTAETKNVWFVLHGMGYLSRYFLKYFKSLNPQENYIICPQAPSKYYLKDNFKHVGASWLTKEDTQQETKNVLTYLNAVLDSEDLRKDVNFVLFGFSQGVSIALRWLVKQKMDCNQVILYAGGIPNEIEPEDVRFLNHQKTKITFVYGNCDQYLTPERLKLQKDKIQALFGSAAEIIDFEGGHEIKQELLKGFVS